MFPIHEDLTRRRFLTAGAFGFGGLTLVDLLRAEQTVGLRSAGKSSQKAIINIHLDGGPPQMDTIDLKPDAPSEIRGEFQPIPTTIPGFHICELLPKIASLADKFVFIRSLVGADVRHDAFQCQSGFHTSELSSLGGRPAMGSVMANLGGLTHHGAPTFVDIMQGRPLARNSARPGILGPTYRPFRPDMSGMFERFLEPGMVGELAALGSGHQTSLALTEGLTAARLHNRADLLADLDRIHREIDASGTMDALDSFTQQAVDILTSGRFARALDLGSEDPRVLERYTMPTPAGKRSDFGDDSTATRKFLLARRLVEAGVRCVSVSISDFDTHSDNFNRMRYLLPVVDHGLSTLIADLDERGMLDDVSIVAWGEFGRTPKIDWSPKSRAGRHHWPNAAIAMLAGGGIRTGQVIGATDRIAAEVIDRPVHYKDVMATLYHNLGIDAHRTTVTDLSGRPHYILDAGRVISEIV
jgi:hypothetical protein